MWLAGGHGDERTTQQIRLCDQSKANHRPWHFCSTSSLSLRDSTQSSAQNLCKNKNEKKAT